MHRRSNLQCNELNRDFSIKNYPVTCDVNNLPQNMRPFSNRFCNNYDYTKEEVDKILKALEQDLKDLKNKFYASIKSNSKFLLLRKD